MKGEWRGLPSNRQTAPLVNGICPTAANGQPAAAASYRGGDGTYRAFGLGVLTVTEAGIARILVFGDGPGLVARFGLPATLPAS